MIFNIFKKENIPILTTIIPFLIIIMMVFLINSYYLKSTDRSLHKEKTELKRLYENNEVIENIIVYKIKVQEEEQKKFENFIIMVIQVLVVFMVLFYLLIRYIVKDSIEKYKDEVQEKENKIHNIYAEFSHKFERSLEEAKKKDKAILAQSRLARLGTMIAMIAHQWRQPLTELSGILMELETATRFKKVNEKHILKSLEKSDTLIEYMSNTIDDFRNFYKPDKQKSNFYISSGCQKAISLSNAALKEASIKLIVDIKDDRELYSYEREFSQVIVNLITNAKDALIEKSIQSPTIKIVLENENSNISIRVEDNGGGVNEQYIDLIFDPYFSTKEASKGSGLGLYISKLIIEQNMNGELKVENNNNGAVFKILL